MSDYYIHPQNWERAYKARNSPPPSDEDELIDWIHLQHVPSAYDTAVRLRIRTLMRKHRGTSARSLAISAPEDFGKTAAVMAGILDDTFNGTPGWFERDANTHRTHIPWVYVNAMTSSSSVSILRQVAAFCGFHPGANEDVVRHDLARLLPLHGVRAIIADESSTLRRQSAASSKIPDGLRGLQHLPIPFVYVGLDLESSALLRDFGRKNDSVRQVKLRTDLLRLTPLNSAEGASEWVNLIGGFGRRMRMIDGFNVEGLKERGLARRLAEATGARPGVLFEALKNAAVEALDEGHGLLTGDLILSNVGGADEAA